MSIFSKQNIKLFFINVGILIVVILVLLFVLNKFLFIYTDHGQSLTVPDFRGKSVTEMSKMIEQKGLRYEIKDTVFDRHYARGSVVDQNPKPNSKVKKNRKIYMVLNGSKAPKVTIPVSLKDMPYKQAEKMLANLDIEVEGIEFVRDMALNTLQGIVVNNKRTDFPTNPLTIEKGTKVKLQLGDGLKNTKVPVPDLGGRTLSEATFILRGNFLNVGRVTFNPGTTDSSVAVVFRQYPDASSEGTVSKGSAVDFWLKIP